MDQTEDTHFRCFDLCFRNDVMFTKDIEWIQDMSVRD